MIISKKALSRRTVLRGFGATLALPLLDSMVPALTAMAKTAAKPTNRFGVVYVPNGMIMQNYLPKTEGVAFEQLAIAPAEPLQLQFEAFMDAVETRRQPKLDGRAARRTLEIALAVIDKIEEHASVVAATLASGWKP